jgi:hypothetical protein
VYRAGFRVLPTTSQPSFSSSGPSERGTDSGITGTATAKLILASALPSASGAASVSATAITTATDAGAAIVNGSGALPVGTTSVQPAFGSPVVITQSGGLTLRLYGRNSAVNADANLSSTLVDGAYVVAELCYYVPEPIGTIDDLSLPGVKYSGFGG